MINFSTPLIQIQRNPDANICRKAIVANALSIIDISTKPNTRKIFEDILGPVKTKWDLDRPYKCTVQNGQYITQGVSTCGLVARGLWRRMNINMPDLYENYKAGTALSAEVAFGMKHKAWQTPRIDFDFKPQPGDYVIIGEGLATHALTAIDWKEDTLISVDGGQVDEKALQCVKKVERKWSIQNNVPYLGTRKVLGWIIFDLLPFKGDTITVPEGWDI